MPPKANPCQGITIGFVVFIVVLIIVFVVLVVTGVIHFGRTPAPAPVVKATCAEYLPSQCQGARTSTGKVCEFKNGVCTEFTPPGPTPPTPLDPVSIAAWFIANPHKVVTIRPRDKMVGYQVAYEGLGNESESSLSVNAIRYKAGDTQDINVRTLYDITSAGSLRSDSLIVTRPSPDTQAIDRVVLATTNTIDVTAIHNQTGRAPLLHAFRGLGAEQYNSAGERTGAIPALTF